MVNIENKELENLIRRGSFLSPSDQFQLVDSLMKLLEKKDSYWAARVHIEGLPRLSLRDQVHIASRWGNAIKLDQPLALRVCSALNKAINLKRKPEVWMESRLEKDPGLTPRRLAYECFYYLRLKREMMPFLINMGRKVKRRVCARRRRALKDGASTESEMMEIDSSEDLCSEEGSLIRTG